MREIYLDTAATTKPDPQVLVDFVKYSEMYPYNPSSIYAGGIAAKNALEEARAKIADCVGCEADEIFFTSGGTESNNMVIKGFFEKLPKNEIGVLITSQIEHPSVLRVAEDLEVNNSRDHIRVYYLPVDSHGIVSSETLNNTITAEIDDGVVPNNILVSIQEANNEIGTVQDWGLKDICEKKRVWHHADVVQYFPHNPGMRIFCYDSVSVSGHKFGALRGTGFVYMSREFQKHISPLLLGGHQELGMRAGTENVAGFCAMADRIKRMHQNWFFGDMEEYNDRIDRRDEYLRELFERLDKKKIDYKINGDSDIPVWSLTFHGVDANALISLLSEKKIFLSAGSACHSYEPEPSHVLKAIGLSDEDAKSTVRICWNPDVTDDEWEFFLEQLIFYIKLLKG